MRKVVHCCYALTLLLVSASVFAASSNTPPDEEMRRITYRAKKLEDGIMRSGHIYRNSDLLLYINSIMARLYPDLKEVFRVKIYLSTEINAFVLPNGSVYVNLGMLAKAENEAQIAAILAHEGAHFVENHQLQKQQELKYIASGADFFGYDRSRSYLSDYSKELEQEADDLGFERLAQAGYDPNEAVHIFSLIAAETKALDIQISNLYSTHPKLIDRIRNFTQLSKGYDGYLGTRPYLEHTTAIKELNLQLHLSKYNYKNIIFNLEDNKALLQQLPRAWYYLGEAYRQRNEKTDAALSRDAYLAAIKHLPEFAPSYRALGIFQLKNQQHEEARNNFQKYLSLTPYAEDRGYIELYYQSVAN